MHGEAFMCFENGLKWMERQPEREAVQLLACGTLLLGNALLSQHTLREMFK